MRRKKLIWDLEAAYFVSFKCPYCKNSIDKGHLEDEGIENGDRGEFKIKCPYLNCQKEIKMPSWRDSK